jgi:hypothetical protein
MANFDMDTYLKSRFSSASPDKTAELNQVRDSKIASILAARQAIAANTGNRIANEAASANAASNSVIGVLGKLTGLGNDGVLAHDGVIGAPINNVVAVGSGLSALTGYVAQTPSLLNSVLLNKDIPQEVKDARARQLKGESTAEDAALMAMPFGDTQARAPVAPGDWMRTLRKDFKTNLQQVTDMESALTNAKTLRDVFDLSSAVHTGSKDKLTSDLGDSAEGSINTFREGMDQIKAGNTFSGLATSAKGLGGALSEIPGAAARNPLGAATFFAENAAQLGASGAGKAAQVLANVGYGMNAFGEGMSEHVKQLGGAMPSHEDIAWKAALAATAVGAEYAGDKITGVTDLFTGAKKALDTKALFKNALLEGTVNNPLTRTASAVLKGGSGEFLTEGYQTWAENSMKMKDTTLNEAYEGGAIGAIIGGGTSTVSHLGKELTGTTDTAVEKYKDKLEAAAKEADAVKNNDTSKYDDPKSPEYNATNAVKVLLEHVELDTTTDDVKKSNLERANTIVTDAEDGVQAAIDAYEQGKKDSVNVLTRKSLSDAVSQRMADLTNARQAQEKLDAAVRGKVDAETVVADLATAKAPVDPKDTVAVQASQEAADRLINLSMASTDSLDETTATELADDTNNGLSAPQRDYLRQFSLARVKQNELETPDSVSKTILDGDDKGNLGLRQYRTAIGRALETGNKSTALRYLEKLASFAMDHEQKSSVGMSTLEQAKNEGVSLQMIRGTEPGSWSTVPKANRIDDLMYMRLNGGFAVHPNNPKSAAVIERMPAEASAINQALLSHVAAYQLKFGEAPKGIVLPAAQTAAAPTSVAPVIPSTTGANNATPASSQAIPPATTSGPTAVTPVPLPLKVDENQAPSAAVGAQVEATQTTPKSTTTPQGKSNEKAAEAEQTGSQQQAQASETVKPQGEDIFTQTRRLEDVAVTEGDIKLANKQLKRLKNPRNSMSLWTALKHSMSQGNLSDIFGSDAKRYNLLKAKKGTSGSDLSSRVREDGLDAFLPYNLRSTIPDPDGSITAKAVDHINASLGAGQYLTYETYIEIENISESINSLEKKLSWLEIEQEIEYAEAEAAQDNESSNSETQKDSSEESTGDPVAPVGEEDKANESVTPEAPKNAGKLAIFEKRVKDSSKKLQDTFRNLNLIAQFFSQSGTKEDNLSNRPLVAVKDFLSAWVAGEVKAEDFLALDGKSLSSEQNRALTQFKMVMVKWLPIIKGTLAVRPKPASTKVDDYVAEDMMQYLYTEDGKAVLEENILLAIGASAYTYVIDKANSPMYLTEKQLVKMHSYPDGTTITPEGQKRLGVMDSLESMGIAGLGQSVVQALGLKANEDAPLDLMPKLEIALGQHVLALLMKQGYATVTEIPSNEVNAYFETETALRDDFERVKYISFKYDTEGTKQVLNKQSNAIREANKGASNVIEKLFGVDHVSQLPATEPQEMVQKKAKKTERDLPKKLRQAIQKAMDIPHTAIPEMVRVFKQLGKAGIMEVAGAKHVDAGRYHAVNLSSIEAKNDGLAKEVDQVLELFDRDGAQGTWFIMGEVWKNFRAGISNRAMNLQSSKVHRALFKQPSWTVTINETENPELLKEFMITVAMGLGEKTDQQRNTKSLKKYFDLVTDDSKVTMYILKNEDAMAAAVALVNALSSEEEWSQETKDLVIKATAKEGMMSLQALVAYSNYLTAKANKASSFEFTLLTGADGKTNGPMLSLLAFGAAGFATLNRGGMYKEGEASHFSEWSENPEAQDLYQHTGLTAVRDVMSKIARTAGWTENYFRQTVAAPYKGKVANTVVHGDYLQAFEVITGKLFEGGKVTKAMRNLVKTPLTAFFFGSSNKSAIASMESAFVAGFYEKIEALKQEELDSGSSDKDAYTKFVNATNMLIDLGQVSLNNAPAAKTPVFEAATLDEAMTMALTRQQETSLRRAFQIVLGHSMASTLKTNFLTYSTVRDTMNSTVQAAWHVYHSAYASARKAEMERLMDEGLIASRISVSKDKESGKKIETRQPLHDMNAKQLAVVRIRVKHLLPILHSAYSRDEDNINVGLQMGKSRATQAKEQFYKGKNFYLGEVKGISVIGSSSVRSRVKEEIDPGVTPTSFSIHSLDSAIMHEALLAFENGLNIHDEMAMGVQDMAKGAEAINKAVVDKLLTYSPMREAANMLQRMILNMAQEVKQGNVTPLAVAQMLDAWADSYNRTRFDDDKLSWFEVGHPLLTAAFNTALNSDRMRLSNISQLHVMDQYTWEGGQYNVPQTVRDEAKKLHTNLPTKIDPKVLAALDDLIKYSADVDLFVGNSIPKETDDDFLDEVPPLSGAASPFGVFVENAAVPVNKIEAAFVKTPVMSAQEVLKLLRNQLKEEGNDTPLRKLKYDLIVKLYSLLPDSVQIKYITPESTLADVIEPPKVTSRAWYVDNGTQQEIYVLGSAFVNSGMQVEPLLHELMHAALVQATRSKSVAAKALVKELTSLMEDARAFVAKPENNLVGRFGAPLSNLDEFLAWGMTNEKFQTEVLMKMTYESKTKQNKLVTAMTEFIDKIATYLFGSTSNSSGLAALISNVSGLLEQSTKGEETGTGGNFSMAAQIDAMSTLEVHDALDAGQVSPLFNAHLKSLLTSVVDALHGPFGAFKDAVAKGVASTPADVFNEAMSTGVAPFTSDLQASGFKFNNQTFYVAEQVEATLKSLLDSKDAKMAAAREELRKLEAEVRGKLKPQDFFKGDWFQATKDERDEATALYNYLFKKVDGDYLARFAALGLAHEGFNTLLKMPTKTAPAVLKDRSVEATLTRMFYKVLETANGKLTSTKPGQDADAKLAALVRELVQIENRNKNTLKNPISGILNFADAKAKATRSTAKDTMNNILNSSMFKKNKIKTIAAASSLVDVVAGNRVRHLVNDLKKMGEKVTQGKHNVATSFLVEMNGHTKSLQKLLREGKSFLEGERKNIISRTNKTILENFDQAGKYLSDDQKSSITSVLLRTGAHVLLNTFDMKGLAALVTDSKALDKEIANYEAKLLTFTPEVKSRLIMDSKALGYFLISNRSKIANMKMNAHNIAQLYMTEYVAKASDSQKAATTAIIDELVSLYALSYSRSADRTALAEVLKIENARTDGNGVELALLSQQHFEKESLSRLFDNNPVQMTKGYIPEIYNPHTDVRAATQAEGEVLLDLGYKKVGELSLDPNDPYRERRTLYVLRNGGMLPWLSGIFSFTNMRAKGTQHHGENAIGTQKVLARNAGTGKVTAGQGEFFDPRTDGVDHMVPTFNADGVAVNYRYMMHASTKDGVMERDSRFDQVLGMLAGSIFDKEESSKHNGKAVQVLYDDFKENFTKRNTLFLAVGPNSTDPELREIYKMLPQSTKDAIKEIWGKEEMLVRPENLDISFGYRKLSISNRFSKDISEQNVLDKGMIALVSAMMKTYGRARGMTAAEATRFAKSNATAVRSIESAIQEIVREAKDIYVVKNVVTSFNNIHSNMLTLALYGVSPIKGLRDMRIAWVSAEEHQRDSNALTKLQLQLDTGYVKGDTSAIELEILRLKEALKNNPITEMIEAGLMPTIVEDVSTEEDPYAYKTLLAKRMKKYTDKVNPVVRTVARNVYMTHDTTAYKSLSRVVQLSDFVARYALYQHLITKEDPMTAEQAKHEASEAFISYDTPMHRELEYMDSIGAFMFTKYFLRVQRVIRGRIKHAPGKLAMLLVAENFLGELPTIVDSSVVLRAGNNPLQSGPLEFLQAIPQLPVIGIFR